MIKYDVRLCDSLEKVLPGGDPRSMKETRISVWPGETFSFQIAAKALRDGHTNGTLEPDLDKAQAARAAYDAFLRDEAAAAVAKR